MTKLDKKDIWRSVKFLLFSISAGVIQIVSFTLLTEFIVKKEWFQSWADTLTWGWIFESEYGPCYLIALILSVLWNFTFNRRFTFKSAANVPIAMLKVFLYYCIFTPLSVWWGIALERAGWNEYLILVLTMVINFVTEFLVCRFFVYGKSIDTNDLAAKETEETSEPIE